MLGIKSPSEDEDNSINLEKWTKIYEGIQQLIKTEAQAGSENIVLCNTSNTDVVKIRRLTEKILQNISATVTVYGKNTKRRKSVAHESAILRTAETETDNQDTATTADSTKKPFNWTTVSRKKTNTLIIKGVNAENYAGVLQNLKKKSPAWE